MRSLDLSYCHKLTVDAIYTLVERGSLTELKLNGCACLKAHDVDEIVTVANLLDDVGGVVIEANYLEDEKCGFDDFFDEASVSSDEETESSSIWSNSGNVGSSSKSSAARKKKKLKKLN